MDNPMNTTRQAARQAEVVAALRPDVLPTIAANDGPGQVPMAWTHPGHLSDVDDEQADWDADLDGYDYDEPHTDPCNHCPHDNADHRGDGCLRCGCDVPQC